MRVIVDAEDDAAWTTAALASHDPARGRLVLHPSPGAAHPPGLAQDLLTALGKRLPPCAPDAPRHRATWADRVEPAWTAAACWINAHRIGHLIVLRAHTLTPTWWAQLGALRHHTGIHLTLIWHHKPDAHLQTRTAKLDTATQAIHDLGTARARFRQQGPARSGTGPREQRVLHRAPSSEGELIKRVQQIGHPLHAGLLTAQCLRPDARAEQLAAVRIADLAPDATGLALAQHPYWPTSPRCWHPVPETARPAMIAARAWHYLHGHRHSSRHLFQHTNFHHHNQLTDIAAALGINPAITVLTGDPAWPSRPDPPPTCADTPA